MAVTRTQLLADLKGRLGTTTGVWTDDELKRYIDTAIEGLYPTFFRFRVAETTATDGPLQAAPPGARNFWQVGLLRENSTRVRRLRGWSEGDGEAHIPKTGINGQTIVWSWTEGWPRPASDSDAISIPTEATEVVVLRSQIAALERLLVDRAKQERYFALHVREAVTEEEVMSILDALHVSLRERTQNVVPLPEVRQ